MEVTVANEWEEKRSLINELHRQLQEKPDSEKQGYSLHPGGILNAYREADISFQEALDALQRTPIILTVDRFLHLASLVKGFEIANEAEVTGATLTVAPYGRIGWSQADALGASVVIELN
jgi:hypothetical protein